LDKLHQQTDREPGNLAKHAVILNLVTLSSSRVYRTHPDSLRRETVAAGIGDLRSICSQIPIGLLNPHDRGRLGPAFVVVAAGPLTVALVAPTNLDVKRVTFDPRQSASHLPRPFIHQLSAATALWISALFLNSYPTCHWLAVLSPSFSDSPS
jgi:hypothetical protein